MSISTAAPAPPPLPVNMEVFDLAFDLLTCPPEDAARKEALSAQTQSLTGKAFEEFMLYSYFIAISTGRREKALDSLNLAFRDAFFRLQAQEVSPAGQSGLPEKEALV